MNGNDVALIDNDFIQQLAGLNYEDEKWLKMLSAMFVGLGCKAGIHELVYDNEMMDDGAPARAKGRIHFLCDNQVVEIMPLDEIKNNILKKKYYEMVFKEIYKEFHGDVIEIDIFNDWKKKCSLGEIHSLTMCASEGYGIFLSDDHGSKKIAEVINARFVHGEKAIKVYDRKEAVDKLQQNDIVHIPKHERKMIKRKN